MKTEQDALNFINDFFDWFRCFHYGQKIMIIKSIKTEAKYRSLRKFVPFLKKMVGNYNDSVSAMIVEECENENPSRHWYNGRWVNTLELRAIKKAEG